MNFLSPIFFWSFAALLPLILIYLLKVRPRRKPTTAYFLWEQIFQEKRPNRLLEKLKDFWSLLLMMFAVSAVCLAMTGPEIADDQRKDLLIVIDNSASMRTLHGGKTRLQFAKEQARRIIRAFHGSQKAVIASMADHVRYHSHLSNNPRELLDALSEIEATDLASNVRALTQAGIREGIEDQRVLLLTDGCYSGEIPDFIETLKVGQPEANLGIIAADLQRVPGQNDVLSLFFRTISTDSEPRQVDLLVFHGEDDSNLFRLVPLQINPGLDEPHVVRLDNASPGQWQIRLDVDDAFSDDNAARLTAHASAPVRVQVISEEPYFFEQSVVAFSGVAGLLQLDTESPDIVISMGAVPENPRVIVFQPEGASTWWTIDGDPAHVEVAQAEVDGHPLLRHIDLASMPFTGARPLKLPENAKVLVASESGIPLIYQVFEPIRTGIVVNLDPIAADFYFSAWFPVLVHSAAKHLAGRDETLLASYRPGNVIAVPGVTQENHSTQVRAKQGESTLRGAKFSPSSVGFYELQNEAGTWDVAVSLLSPQESKIDNDTIESSLQPLSQGWPMSYWLSAVAVVVLTAESLLYHRRKVG